MVVSWLTRRVGNSFIDIAVDLGKNFDGWRSKSVERLLHGEWDDYKAVPQAVYKAFTH